MDFSQFKDERPLVNSWTDFGELEVIVIGRVDEGQCFVDQEPGFKWKINDKNLAQMMEYPTGVRLTSKVREAQE